jgi:hypothetical protein
MACLHLVGLSRDSYRHAPVTSARTEALKTKIVKIDREVSVALDGKSSVYAAE